MNPRNDWRSEVDRKPRRGGAIGDRAVARARQLHEQGADLQRLRQSMWRWYRWLHGGLRGRVSTKGRFTRIWITVLKRLHINGDSTHSD